LVPLKRLGAITILLFLLTGAGPALAEEAPASVTIAYSPYEMAAIRDAEKALGTEVDYAAEGKIVEGIDAIRLDPVDPHDPVPLALNAAHITTKHDVVVHEVLLRPGDRYRKILADESARNLRAFAYMSIIVCVPMKGSAPNLVRVVMITKDVWSLIADVDFHVTSGGIERLMFEIEENNFAGRQVGISARSILQPESVSFGGAYVAPRLAGRWLKFQSEGNVIINRRSGEPEGSFGHAVIEQPLYTTRTPWAWSTGLNWNDEVYRRYTNADVARFEDTIPWVFRSRRIEQIATVTKSLGWARKNDFTLGLQLIRDFYRVRDESLYEPQQVAAFKTAAIPVGEARSLAFVQWRNYRNDFLRIVDFETLSLQEDYRLGPDIVLKGYPVLQAFGSTRDLVGARAAASYTISIGDGFARALVDTTTEAELHRIADASLGGEIRLVSPRTGLGRLVFDVTAQNRWRNYLNRLSVLGGEDRLRGWPTRYFVGKNVFATNLEFRTRPIQISSIQAGAAFFYDTGRAFNENFDQISPAHSVGAGIRLVIPELDRAVLRGDFGFPISAGDLPAGVLPMSFFFSFHQAFRTSHMPGPMGP
jgi:hypothetical protein